VTTPAGPAGVPADPVLRERESVAAVIPGAVTAARAAHTATVAAVAFDTGRRTGRRASWVIHSRDIDMSRSQTDGYGDRHGSSSMPGV
jgi:hypothetical protein